VVRAVSIIFVLVAALMAQRAVSSTPEASDAQRLVPSLLYSLEEGRGERVRDSIGRGPEARIVGGATWGEGYRGGALLFNGSNRIELASTPEVNLQGPFSISAWIKGRPSFLHFVEGNSGFRSPNA
jgi:hypothetical protein